MDMKYSRVRRSKTTPAYSKRNNTARVPEPVDAAGRCLGDLHNFAQFDMTSRGLRYHVTVAFRQGYGETFSARSTALEYAEQQLNKLLAEHDGLEHETFS